MLKPNPILLSVTVLLVASLACSFGVSTEEPDVLGTSVAATIAARQTQNAEPGIPITGLNTPTSTPIVIQQLPTNTPPPTLTPAPLFTATPVVPMVSVSVPTNCRLGPGKVYDRVGALLVDETAEVVGRASGGNYWYIRNPDATNDFCWLWGEYATVTGNYASLPLMTPPPTPIPSASFEASLEGRDTCNGWWLDIILENTGGVSFRSVSVTVKDTVTGTTHSISSDSFTDFDSCSDYVTFDTLNPDGMRVMSSPKFDYDPHGHKVDVTLTLCSNKGLNGTCTTEKVSFTP